MHILNQENAGAQAGVSVSCWKLGAKVDNTVSSSCAEERGGAYNLQRLVNGRPAAACA